METLCTPCTLHVNQYLHVVHTSCDRNGRRHCPEVSTAPAIAGINLRMMRTIYCVQPYQRSDGRLVKDHMRRLLSRDAAIRAAQACKGLAVGVVVYRVTGSPEMDFWSDPVLIARAGDVPAEARRF